MAVQTTIEGLIITINVTAFGLIAAIGGEASFAVSKHLRRQHIYLETDGQSEGYEDQDGVATEESLTAFSDKLPRDALYVAVGIGAWLSLAEVIVLAFIPNTMYGLTRWMRLGAWALLATSAFALKERKYTARFAQGLQTSIGCLSMVGILATEQYGCYQAMESSFMAWFFLAGQSSAALGACIAGTSFPRRPDVFHKGVLVDRKSSTTFLNRLFFGWASPLLSARQTGKLKVCHLPELEYASRSENLFHAYQQTRLAFPSSSLWKILVLCHRRALLIQLCLTILNATMAFVPQFCVLGILRCLENDSSRPSLCLFVFGLGMSTILSALLENWNMYISSNQIAVRLQEQLSTVIYNKALRSKPVSSAEIELNSASNGKSSSQSAMNLVAVDAKKVADFSALGLHLYEAPLKLCLAAISIGRLMGGRCLFAGGVVLLLVTGGNIYAVRQYATKQKGLLRSRDNKIGIINEVIQGIRQVKLSALEDKWEGRINDSRRIELQNQWMVYQWELLMFVAYNLAPVLVSTACLGTYALLHEDMPASTVFTSMSLLGALETPLAVLPQILLSATGAQISLRRIERFLRSPDRDVEPSLAEGVILEQATISWNGNLFSKSFTLKDLTLTFPSGALSIITGPSGSGKSLVLAAILGECEFLQGRAQRPSADAIAYVAQEPCMKDGTIRENIIYGLQFEQERYASVLFACSLDRDLKSLPLKDETQMDTQGTTFSGGQKWRISLARALYSNAKVLVMDDIFSSIDPHTAQHLYEHALTGTLVEGRTRILATYHLELCLPRAEYVVALDASGLHYAGPRKNLREIGIFQDMPHAAAGVDRRSPLKTDTLAANNAHILESWTDRPMPFQQEQFSSTPQEAGPDLDTARDGKWRNRRRIFRLTGAKYHCLLLLALYLSYSGLAVGRGLWMMVWSSRTSNSGSSEDTQSTGGSVKWFLFIYLTLSIGSCVVAVSRSFLAVRLTLQMSRRLFEGFLSSILRAPLQWLDKIPPGNILNNFSADFSLIDSRLGYDLNYALGVAVELFAIVLAASLVNAWLNLLSACALLLALYYGRLFVKKIRTIKELESAMRGPVLHHLCSTMDGIMTVRAYQQEEVYRGEMYSKVDRHCRASWTLWLLTRWIAIRASTIGAVFTTAASILVLSSNNITAATAGFAITFIMRYSSVMSQVIRQYANLEISLNSVERVAWSLDIPREKYEADCDTPVPDSWPTEGQLDVSDLVVCYSPDLPPVLSHLTFSVPPNSRVGVVGRTGAGKSSLAMALFRFLEAQQGNIHVAGVNISSVSLQQLRTRLAIVPQDPILFSGTVRSNLDPFDEYSDQELLAALRRVHWTTPAQDYDLKYSDDPVVNLLEPDLYTLELSPHHPLNPLTAPVSSRGSNFSQGQRQCLCLARAILRRPKILVLDEATSAIDKTTDAVIQSSIRTEFGRNDSSLLVIAHRISTIADFDRVLVLDAGRVAEYGTPKELAVNPAGIFRGLVDSSVEREELLRTIGVGRA
ncbi:ABC transporter family protein [Aspergillus heteromorphus CBS 117.55]|uniref:ABC transporter family protein n=1 Tax=Aspergillus heteromorphus CBS 117.55 TaxID=1448321 RepID=A0A317WJY6_9EURO|nr:ABC transporter family protein [Aspergillus heteromorphus CBS 117.55]PWY86764.1 ABC transporter family protein [Aspergillus heteromorphus CBS 117.55]